MKVSKQFQKENQALVFICQDKPHIRNAALSRFIKRNEKMFRWMAYPYTSANNDQDEFEDAINIVRAAVSETIDKYDRNKNVLFVSYFAYIVHGKLSHWLKYKKGLFPTRNVTVKFGSLKESGVKKIRTDSIGQTTKGSKFYFINEEVLSSRVMDNRIMGEHSSSGSQKGGIVERLFMEWLDAPVSKRLKNRAASVRGKRVIKYHLCEGLGLREIGIMEGISHEMVRQILEKDMPFLRRDMLVNLHRVRGYV